jgi:hypothetical protein
MDLNHPVVYILTPVFIVQGISTFWAYRDGKSRGKSGILIALFVLLLAWPVSLLLWLTFRPNRVDSSEDEPVLKRFLYGVLATLLIVLLVGGKSMIRRRELRRGTEMLNEVEYELKQYESLLAEVSKTPEQFKDTAQIQRMEKTISDLKAQKKHLENRVSKYK